MRYILLFVTSLLIISFIFFNPSCKSKQAIVYKLENKKYCLLVADSLNEWNKGLMDYRGKQNFDGMIFIFPNKEPRTFWNLNTYLDLDIYWLRDDQVTGKSYLPSIEKSGEVMTVSSRGEVNKVVEILK